MQSVSCLTKFSWVTIENNAYEFLLNSNWNLNLQNLCNTLHLIDSHISSTYIKFQPSTHVILYCTYVAPLIVVCRIEVEPEPEGTPFVEDPETEPRQQGKQPPL